jgi:hypothetical protein
MAWMNLGNSEDDIAIAIAIRMGLEVEVRPPRWVEGGISCICD